MGKRSSRREGQRGRSNVPVDARITLFLQGRVSLRHTWDEKSENGSWPIKGVASPSLADRRNVPKRFRVRWQFGGRQDPGKGRERRGKKKRMPIAKKIRDIRRDTKRSGWET